MTDRRWLWLWLICCLSYLPLLFSVQFTGEEAIYSIIPFEMSESGKYLEPTIYGEAYRRPPFLNWLVIGLASIGGWDNTVFYLRLLSSVSSVLSSALIFLFLFRHVGVPRNAAVLGAVFYLVCWQVLGGYGWKGYSDAVFGFFVMSSIFLAWLAIERSTVHGWAVLASLSCFLAFLTKAITSYTFLLVFLVIYFFVGEPNKRTRVFIVISWTFLSISLVFGWYALTPFGAMMASGASVDIFDRFTSGTFQQYLANAVHFSGETYFNLFPVSVLLTYLWLKLRSFDTQTTWGNVAGLTAFVNFLPYAVTTHTHSRYLMPLYGFVALYCLALYLRQRTAQVDQLSWRLLLFIVALKLVFVGGLFHYYTELKRPNLDQFASKVIEIADGRRIYSTDESWIGISVSDLINRSRVQSGFITSGYKESSSFVLLSRHSIAKLGSPVLLYRGEFFVYCRGVGSTGAPCPTLTVNLESLSK